MTQPTRRKPPKPNPKQQPISVPKRRKQPGESNPKPKKKLSDDEQRIFDGLAHNPLLQFTYLQSISQEQET